LAVGGRRQLALFAFLLVHANRAVSSDAIADALWGPERAGADNRLAMAVVRLRRVLEPLGGDGDGRLRTVGGGYLLSVGPGELDAQVFSAGVQDGRRAVQAGDFARGMERLDMALGLWRGPALAEVAFEEFAQPEIRRLDELRLVAVEARVDAYLELGREAEAIGELEALVTEQPARERLAAQLMLALYRCGRQAEALEVYQRIRGHLAQQLGLEPGPALQALQAQILAQAPSLEVPVAGAQAGSVAPAARAEIAPLVRSGDGGPGVVSEREHRKTVTALFVDLVGSTVMGGQLDPEALRALMIRYYEVLRAAIEAYGGRVEKFIGDAVVALFGVPTVHEDDALRAVRAVLAARERLEQLNLELEDSLGIRIQTRAGINTGEIVVADRPDGEGFVVGDVLNVAARLQSSADAGEALLGEASFAIVRHAIEAERVGPLAVKGKHEPLVAYRLIGVIEGANLRERRHRSPLIGRDHELRLLLDAYDRCSRERAPHLFTVLGPAGVGKSRLIEEAAAACEGATVLSGRCLSYGDGITFWPLAEIVRDAAGLSEADSSETVERKLTALLAGEDAAATIAAILAGLIGVREQTAQIEESFWAVRRLFEAISRHTPLIVIFEDVHWAEPTLLDLVDHVADMARNTPILIACIARAELLDTRPAWAGGKRNATSVHLEPLTPEESTELIEGLLGATALPEQITRRIADGSEGFPLFVEEMIAMLVEDGLIRHDQGHWTGTAELADITVPPTIRALLAERLDGLPTNERRALELASIVGREFWQAAITAIAPDETETTNRTTLAALVRKDLIVPERSTMTGEDSYRFRHILIRDAAYASLPKLERAELHERFATWLEHALADRLDEVEEIIGYHLQQAHAYRTTLGERRADLATRAAIHLSAAGRRALTRADTRAASTLLERARSLVGPGSPAHRQLGLDLGTALFRGGDFEHARTVLHQVEAEAEATQDVVGAAHARVDLAQIRIWMDPEGAADNARREADQAMPVFQQAADNLGLAKALMVGGIRDNVLARYAPFRESYERVLEHLRTAGDRVWVTWVLGLIADAVTWGPTPIPEAIPRLQDIVGESGGNPELRARVLACTGVLRAMQGREQEALVAEAQAEGILRDLGVDYHLTWLALYGGDLLRLLGRLDRAEQLLREVDEIHERSAERNIRSTILAKLSQVLVAQRRIDEANRTALHAIDIGSSEDALTLTLAHGTLAKVLLWQGDPAAEPAARRAVALAEQTDAPWLQGEQWEVLAEALVGGGRGNEANAAFRTALDRFERKAATAPANRVRAGLQMND
jgi:class 3 adenylate cyclase/DNA-binding SARP family transcriptional activator